MKTFLQKLVDQNIYLKLDQGELSVKFPKTGVSSSLIQEIKLKKQELISYLDNLNDVTDREIPVLTKQDNYALSFSQLRIWKLCRLEGGSIAHNISGTLELGVVLNKDEFLMAINTVIDRHEILRTVFKINALGIPRQHIVSRKDIQFKMGYFDCYKEKHKEDFAGTCINEDAFLPFDLENGPLFRATLFRMEKNRYIFYYNMHGIIADGESIDIFTREVMAYMEAFNLKERLRLPELKIQYKEFADWQLKLNDKAVKENRAYWVGNLSGELPLLDLPNQKNRPKTKTFKGKLLGTNITKASTDKLKQFVNANGGNLLMAVLASWKVLFYYYTSQKDIIIGTPVFGREHMSLEGQMGAYVNTVPIRSQLNPEESFLKFHKTLKDIVLKSYSFQYPYEKIVEDLKFNRPENRNPVFDVVLSAQSEEQVIEDFTLLGIEKGTIIDGGIGKKYVDTIVSKYDLEIDFRELGGCLWFNINYNTDLYDRDMIVDLLFLYKKLLKSILEDCSSPINAVLNLKIDAFRKV